MIFSGLLVVFNLWLHDVQVRWEDMCKRSYSWPSYADCMKDMPDCKKWVTGRWTIAGWPSSKPGETCQYDKLPRYIMKVE